MALQIRVYIGTLHTNQDALSCIENNQLLKDLFRGKTRMQNILLKSNHRTYFHKIFRFLIQLNADCILILYLIELIGHSYFYIHIGCDL